MTKILNFALEIKESGRESGTCKVLRPCHPQNLTRAHGDALHTSRVLGPQTCLERGKPLILKSLPITCNFQVQ